MTGSWRADEPETPGEREVAAGRADRGDQAAEDRRVADRRVTQRRTDEEHAVRAARREIQRLSDELDRARAEAAEARKVAEQAAADARDAAEVVNRAKSEFLATMSHELRTPINAIAGYAQLLDLGVAGPLTEVQREYLVRLQTSGRHLLGLVDDILDFARLEAGEVRVACEANRTDAVVEAALALVAPQAASRGIRLADASQGTEGVRYVGDPHRVRRVLLELLSNAIKFTPPAGTVSIRAELVPTLPPGAPPLAAGPWTAIRVRDTGAGVAPGSESTIFEPFVQGDGSRTRTVGGTGLGLSIARALARLMGGEISVQSTPGVGAEFTLWLPTDVVEPEPAGAARVTEPERRTGARSVAGLAVVGAQLRDRVEAICDALVARLRTDPAFPGATSLTRPQLEDHAATLLTDLATSLVAIEETGGFESDLLRDGSAIQEEIAIRHGEQRHRIGWSTGQIAREHELLLEEIDRALGLTDGPETALARSVVHRLIDRSRETSFRGFHLATLR